MAALKRKRAAARSPDGSVEVAPKQAAPKHASLPKYAPFAPYDSPDLKRAAYKPRDLLNFATKTFHSREDVELSDGQRTARGRFVELFNKRQNEYEAPFDKEKLETYQRDMHTFLCCLDSFFFLGQLEQHIELDASMDRIAPEDEKCESHTAITEKDGKHLVRITVNLGSDNELNNLETLIGSLVHALVHAWYLAFACFCAPCARDSLNTTGPPPSPHGPLFLALHRLLIASLRHWDASLSPLQAADMPKDAISQRAKKAQQAFLSALPAASRRRYNPVRSPRFGALFVRLTDDDRVVVRAALKAGQMRVEEGLKKEREREREKKMKAADFKARIEDTEDRRPSQDKAEGDDVKAGADGEGEG
ncbi:hypothetical protein GGS24DRAFT_410687 [Hypoxylon argillaceum]|nr:hypothetical protein GGS24DRAFT_410687 [Hypoxylon argillaceum]